MILNRRFPLLIRPVDTADALAISGIYNYYIANTVVSFEEDQVSAAEMENRIRNVTAKYPWFVWEDEEMVLGYAYVNTWKERVSYRYAVEDSLYIKNGMEGKGIGGKLFAHLLEAVKQTTIHAVVAGITLPNDPSVAIHEKFGFKKIAQFNEIGFKMNKWLDVGLLGKGSIKTVVSRLGCQKKYGFSNNTAMPKLWIFMPLAGLM